MIHAKMTRDFDGNRPDGLFYAGLSSPQVLEPGSPLLGFQPPLSGGEGRAGLPAFDRPHRSVADQLDEPLQRVGAVALLGAVALRRDDEHAVLSEPPPCKGREAVLQVGGKRRPTDV